MLMPVNNWSIREQREGLTIWQHDQTSARVHAVQLHAWWLIFVTKPDIRGRLELGFESSARAAERSARNFMVANEHGGDEVAA